jgi:hypothetical protein
MSKRRTFGLTLLLAIVFSLPSEATAQDDQIHTAATIRFGSSIQLAVSTTSGTPILRAAIFLRTDASGSTRVEYAEPTEQDPATATISLNPASIGLSAFETLYYHWQIDLESGLVLQSEELQLDYKDDRFNWERLEADSIKVLWHDRDLQDAQDALDTAHTSLETIAQSYALFPSRTITVVLYNNSRELQSALELEGAAWVGGTSRPETGIMLVSAPSGPEGLIELERLIPHEMVHLLIGQRSDNGVLWTPTWLAEGMATLVEGAPSPARREALIAAADERSLIPLLDLCAAFPASEQQATLAYAESASFVRYLLDIYGQGGLTLLLDAYREGTTCEGGLARVYQRPISQLEAEWQTSIGVTPFRSSWLLFVLLAVVCLSAGFLIFRRSRRNKSASLTRE